MTFFSVVLPVFNRQKSISFAIQSVLDQTFEDWELLIIDDCSTDSTFEEIQKYNDSRIRFFHNSVNSGPAVSRNLGIRESKGEVICFLDSDDCFYPNFLSQIWPLYQSSLESIGFSWTGLEIKYRDGIKIEIWNPEIIISPYHTFLYSLKIGTNSGLSVKKLVFEKCGLFNENLLAAEDTEFLLRIVQKFSFKVVQQALIFIDKSGRDRLSLNYTKNAKSYNMFIGQHWDYIMQFSDLKRKYYYKLMWLNYHLGDFSNARKYYALFKKDFGYSIKPMFIKCLFEIFGSKLGAKAHIFLAD